MLIRQKSTHVGREVMLQLEVFKQNMSHKANGVDGTRAVKEVVSLF